MGINSVSCVTSSFCVAVQTPADPVVWNGTRWSAARPLGPGNESGDGTPVSCASVRFCVVLDGHHAYTWNGAASPGRAARSAPGVHGPGGGAQGPAERVGLEEYRLAPQGTQGTGGRAGPGEPEVQIRVAGARRAPDGPAQAVRGGAGPRSVVVRHRQQGPPLTGNGIDDPDPRAVAVRDRAAAEPWPAVAARAVGTASAVRDVAPATWAPPTVKAVATAHTAARTAHAPRMETLPFAPAPRTCASARPQTGMGSPVRRHRTDPAGCSASVRDG